ncbi:MAG TPA: hypothetical protein VFG88_10915 [Nocardioidaceae bacterium]|jgi:MinD-like ATPase involved in chromosome partitioning or flagellar assembly|nr:hypothetical protein [Nocardioidaceae bacterium]
MALIALASAKGAPGVSVATAGLAAVWPRRCVVADLDPAGGDVPLRYRREDGDPLDPDTGLLSLAVAVRRGTQGDLEEHLQRTSAGMETLVGVGSPGQVQGLGAAWPFVAAAMRDLPDADVLVDLGRVTPGSAVLPILERADGLVMVTGSSLEEVAHLRERLGNLKELLGLGNVDGIPVGVAVRTSARDTRSLDDTVRLLDSSRLPVTGLGVVAEDAKAAEVVRTESGRSIRRSVLLRSLTDLAGAIETMVTSARSVRSGVF